MRGQKDILGGGGLVQLQPLSASHVGDLVAAVQESVAELAPWLPWAHRAYGARDATEFLRTTAHEAPQGLHLQFAVLSAEGRFVGGLGLRISDEKNGVASIGYWTRSSATRRGYATAATRVAAAHAFGELGVHRIEIFAREQNVASRRVAERAGATFECIARNRIAQNGVSYPAALYSLIPADLRAA